MSGPGTGSWPSRVHPPPVCVIAIYNQHSTIISFLPCQCAKVQHASHKVREAFDADFISAFALQRNTTMSNYFGPNLNDFVICCTQSPTVIAIHELF